MCTLPWPSRADRILIPFPIQPNSVSSMRWQHCRMFGAGYLRAEGQSAIPSEIRLMHRQMETVATYPAARLALRMILLTLVRKSELIQSTWDEVDFEAAVRRIPKSRMKARRPYNIYLSQQALDIMVTLHTCAAGSRYVLPSRYDPDRCRSRATLNRMTGSTLLNEAGFNGEWIEKCLAHEEGQSSRSVYNKAEYAEQRRHMLQEWANMIDAWAAGETYTPTWCPAPRMEQQSLAPA